MRRMDTYEVLILLFLGETFLIPLIAYLDDRNNKKINAYPVGQQNRRISLRVR